MPQLPLRGVHGHLKAEPARGDGSRAVPVYGGTDMHRLPQGHCPQAAGHDRSVGVAVVMATGVTRRALLLSCGPGIVALLGPGPPAAAQDTTTERPIDPGRFFGFAYSSAVLQERA